MKIIDNLDNEVKQTHFLDYQDFCEIKLQNKVDEDGYCYKCNKPLEPLTYLDPDFYYQPCWICHAKRRTGIDRDSLTENLRKAIHEFYGKIVSDRYYQLFLVDDIYPHTTFPHTYNVFKKAVNSLSPPSRNDIWFLDWVPGYPKIISIDNLSGIKIINITKLYDKFSLEKDVICVGDYEIKMPELTKFDSRHHSRYSILNKNGDRKSKKLKLGDKCIRFYNTDDDSVKSIFQLTKNGEEIPIRSISYQDLVIIKLAIMRDKAFLRLIFDIIEELTRSIGILRDSVFLKNTVILNPKKEDIIGTIMWTSICEYKIDNSINISII